MRSTRYLDALGDKITITRRRYVQRVEGRSIHSSPSSGKLKVFPPGLAPSFLHEISRSRTRRRNRRFGDRIFSIGIQRNRAEYNGHVSCGVSSRFFSFFPRTAAPLLGVLFTSSREKTTSRLASVYVIMPKSVCVSLTVLDVQQRRRYTRKATPLSKFLTIEASNWYRETIAACEARQLRYHFTNSANVVRSGTFSKRELNYPFDDPWSARPRSLSRTSSFSLFPLGGKSLLLLRIVGAEFDTS